MFCDDLKAKTIWLYGDLRWIKLIRAFFSDATLSMILYRTMSWCDKYYFMKFFAFVFGKINAVLCGAVIGKSARFGSGFVILHSVGVVINSRVCGGRNIYVESGVVIGETKRGCPVLGSDIFIGSGAKIVGAITIGNNVTIGANAFVNKSIQDDVVVGGIPAKILRHKLTGEKTVG